MHINKTRINSSNIFFRNQINFVPLLFESDKVWSLSYALINIPFIRFTFLSRKKLLSCFVEFSSVSTLIILSSSCAFNLSAILFFSLASSSNSGFTLNKSSSIFSSSSSFFSSSFFSSSFFTSSFFSPSFGFSFPWPSFFLAFSASILSKISLEVAIPANLSPIFINIFTSFILAYLNKVLFSLEIFNIFNLISLLISVYLFSNLCA